MTAAPVAVSPTFAKLDERVSAVGRGNAVLERLEALPLSPWHRKIRILVGSATFFDAFDALAIASVLPVLIGIWHLTPGQAGALIATGYLGQGLGAVFFGWLAERVGRVPAALYSILVFSVMSVACAFSWSYAAFVAFRFVQGFGLGGEVPIAATYISEMSKAQTRGRFVLTYEALFNLGIVISALVGAVIVPNYGWQLFLAIGALPALLIVPMRKKLPESLRWLVARGRLDQAERTISDIETEVFAGKIKPPQENAAARSLAIPPDSGHGLFEGIYLRRTLTVWTLWFCIFLVGYGTMTWLPSIIRTVYKLPLQTALLVALGMSTLSLIATLLCALVMDRIGRRLWFTVAAFISSAAMAALWAIDGTTSLLLVGAIGACAVVANATSGVLLYLYTPEIYSSANRARGVSVATIWARLASIVGPAIIGVALGSYGLGGVYIIFSLASLVAAVVAMLFVVETKQRTLEELSP